MLVDITSSKKKDPLGKGKGRPVDSIIALLSIRCKHKVTKKLYYRCVGKDCKWHRSGAPQKNRLLVHSVNCRGLLPELQKEANDAAASRSLGAQVSQLKSHLIP